MAKTDVAIAALLSLIAALIFYPFASVGLDPHHDGIMLKPALDVLSGQVLHRDTFSQYGSLTTYLQALALAVHPALLSLRVLSVFANAASLFFLFLAWRVLLPRSLSLVASLLFVIHAQFYDPSFPLIPWSSVLALFFQSVAMFSLMRIVVGPAHAAWPWVLGAACSFTVWCRQPVGIILTLSVGTIAAALHFTGWRVYAPFTRRLWARAVAAFCSVCVLILGHLALHGAVNAWWEQTILWPTRWAQGYNDAIFWNNARVFLYPPESLVLVATLLISFLPATLRRRWRGLPRWVDLAWLIVLGGVYVAFARPLVRPSLCLPGGGWDAVVLAVYGAQAIWVSGLAFWRRPGSGKPFDHEYHAGATLGGLALGSAAQIYPLPEPNHLYWALAPGLGVVFYFCHRLLCISAAGCSVVFLLLLAPAAYDKYRWGTYTLSLPAQTLINPPVLSGMRVSPPLAAALERSYAIIQPILQKNPEQQVILYGYDALYLAWFNNRENPSPYYVNWHDLMPPADRLKRLNYLFKTKPVLLLHGKGTDDLRFIPVDYEIGPHEPLLDLRIALPAQVRTDGVK